jgi:hypothetical protein
VTIGAITTTTSTTFNGAAALTLGNIGTSLTVIPGDGIPTIKSGSIASLVGIAGIGTLDATGAVSTADTAIALGSSITVGELTTAQALTVNGTLTTVKGTASTGNLTTTNAAFTVNGTVTVGGAFSQIVAAGTEMPTINGTLAVAGLSTFGTNAQTAPVITVSGEATFTGGLALPAASSRLLVNTKVTIKGPLTPDTALVLVVAGTDRSGTIVFDGPIADATLPTFTVVDGGSYFKGKLQFTKNVKAKTVNTAFDISATATAIALPAAATGAQVIIDSGASAIQLQANLVVGGTTSTNTAVTLATGAVTLTKNDATATGAGLSVPAATVKGATTFLAAWTTTLTGDLTVNAALTTAAGKVLGNSNTRKITFGTADGDGAGTVTVLTDFIIGTATATAGQETGKTFTWTTTGANANKWVSPASA